MRTFRRWSCIWPRDRVRAHTHTHIPYMHMRTYIRRAKHGRTRLHTAVILRSTSAVSMIQFLCFFLSFTLCFSCQMDTIHGMCECVYVADGMWHVLLLLRHCWRYVFLDRLCICCCKCVLLSAIRVRVLCTRAFVTAVVAVASATADVAAAAAASACTRALLARWIMCVPPMAPCPYDDVSMRVCVCVCITSQSLYNIHTPPPFMLWSNSNRSREPTVQYNIISCVYVIWANRPLLLLLSMYKESAEKGRKKRKMQKRRPGESIGMTRKCRRRQFTPRSRSCNYRVGV